jgi:hypothetical protein
LTKASIPAKTRNVISRQLHTVDEYFIQLNHDAFIVDSRYVAESIIHNQNYQFQPIRIEPFIEFVLAGFNNAQDQ